MKDQHTDREKAESLLALVANKGNVKRTAEQQELPHKTLDNWKNGIGINDDVRKMVTENQLNLALELDSLAFQAVGLLPGKLPDASVRELVGVFAQAIQNSQLLKGQPTNITQSLTEEQKAAELASLYEEQREAMRKKEADKLIG